MRIHWRDPNMSLRKWVKTLIMIVAPFLLLFLIGYPLLRSYILAHPFRYVDELDQAKTGQEVERVTFAATDGIKLVGWFVPGDGNGATIVVSHGSGGNGPGTYPLVAFLNQAGYHLFLFDHRAHGQSGGKSTTFGPREVRDLVGAVAYLRTRPDVNADAIGAIGCSMGSGIVIGAAAEEPAIKAVVAESAYADLGQVWDRFGYVGLRNTSISWSWGKPMQLATWIWTGEWIARFKPEQIIDRISPRAVLIIHGDQDPSACTVDDARRLYQAAQQPKELWIVPGAGHCAARALYPEEYQARVVSFFDRMTAPEQP